MARRFPGYHHEHVEKFRGHDAAGGVTTLGMHSATISGPSNLGTRTPSENDRLSHMGDSPQYRETAHVKALDLATEIANIEQRAQALEVRNKWLNHKLLMLQKTFIGKTLAGGARFWKAQAFKGWKEIMSVVRLERELEDVNASLNEHQELVSTLGLRMAAEKERRKTIEESSQGTGRDLHRLRGSCEELRYKIEMQQSFMEKLERRLQLASGILLQSREQGGTLSMEVNRWEKQDAGLKTQAAELRRQGQELEEPPPPQVQSRSPMQSRSPSKSRHPSPIAQRDQPGLTHKENYYNYSRRGSQQREAIYSSPGAGHRQLLSRSEVSPEVERPTRSLAHTY